ncbi:Beige/BEACH domain containing protein [Histomonas meleagridis]|uniref:Beige/BEACH domain containing protein n=1 Tax=Histomonas meleagridis TaxID=135588 RepID=UPI00355A37DA|nr:Beige/BEACH domain containing protein [Histomonas meleagridis]KAH0803413.1 Beige/BEACH domain containing protein [Histomonas meleagridis]
MEDGNFFLSASKTGEVKIFFNNSFEEPYSQFSTLTDNLSAITFSDRYSTVVCGTSGCRVSIYSIHKAKFINYIDLDDIPLTIQITKALGIIVICLQKEIVLTTINGFLIRKVKFDFEIDKVCTFAHKGIDFLLMADTNGHVFSSEAFYPEKKSLCLTYKGKLERIYVYKNAITAITYNGDIYSSEF